MRVTELIKRETLALRDVSRPSWLSDFAEMSLGEVIEFRSVQAIARAASVTREHLARSFHSSYGVSPVSYLRSCRAKLASKALMSGLDPLGEIAYDCGYSDQSHMTRELRLFYGETPAQIRARSTVRIITSVQDRRYPIGGT